MSTTVNSYEQQFLERTGKSFPEYYNKYYDKLVWYIQKYNVNKLDAEGLANDAFMQSLNKIELYKPEYNYSTWLFTIAKHLMLQFKTDNSKTILVDTTSEMNSDENAYNTLQFYLNNQLDISTDVEETSMVTSMKYDVTLKEIAKLDNKYKEYIELCDIQGKSYEEISKILNVELQTVKNRLHHGRAKLEKATKSKFKEITKDY